MSANNQFTRADWDAFGRMPDGRWFGAQELDYMIRRPYWRCERLTRMGLLKTNVRMDEMHNTTRVWFKLAPDEIDRLSAKKEATP